MEEIITINCVFLLVIKKKKKKSKCKNISGGFPPPPPPLEVLGRDVAGRRVGILLFGVFFDLGVEGVCWVVCFVLMVFFSFLGLLF